MSCPYKRKGYSQCISPYNCSTKGGTKGTTDGYDSTKCYGLNSQHETCAFYISSSTSKNANVPPNTRIKCPHCNKDVSLGL